MTEPAPSPAPAAAVALRSHVAPPDPTEKLDTYLHTKVAPSLGTLIGPRTDGYTPEMLLKLTMIALQENTALASCAPLSIALALHKVARLKLIIGETIYLVPIKGKCEAWVSYHGLMQLAMESGLVRDIAPYVVWSDDVFEYGHGLEEFCRHYPARGPAATPDNPRRMTHAWCLITKRYGVRTFHVMPMEQIEARRKTSRSWGPSAYPVCPDWYAKKTVVRDWLNRQPKNARLSEALAGEPEETVDMETGEVLS